MVLLILNDFLEAHTDNQTGDRENKHRSQENLKTRLIAPTIQMNCMNHCSKK